MEIWATIAAERRALADQLATLTDEQWSRPSLCSAWTVRDVAAHLVMPHTVTVPRFLSTLARNRGSFARANIAMTASVAVRPPAELVDEIRRHADGRFVPPGMGPAAPLTDVLVHGQDIRVPLGLPDSGEPERWRSALDFLMSPKARSGFVSGRLPALTFTASDLAWSHGSGPEVRGPAAALGLAVLGRTARLDELSGAGVPTLVAWLRR